MISTDVVAPDLIDEALWILTWEICIGASKADLVNAVERIRWMRQGERAQRMFDMHQLQTNSGG